jgi:chromosomal replication initiator protein
MCASGNIRKKEDYLNIWSASLAKIKARVGESEFESWFEPVECTSIQDGRITLRIPNEIFKTRLEKQYKSLLAETFAEVINIPPDDIVLKFSSDSGGDMSNEGLPEKKHAETALNPKYTFENFVVGGSNQFTHAACLAVAESPVKAYNPLFIYGGVGLGKTHLMQAIGWFILNKTSSNFRVVYLSCENFTNELITAIRTKNTQAFRAKFRSVDLLLIDDIQFLAGKESTQEEFFHTFNALYDAHKQIVVSSDRQPKEIPMMEERLVSRFDWGLISDIQPPDLETRIAILNKKCEMQNIFVPDDIILFIANKIKFNIRELEGALTKTIAYASLNKRELTLESAQEALKDIIPKEKPITIDLIQAKTADYFDLHILDMKKKNRSKNVALPRQIAMYLSRELTKHSLPEIGDAFGGRDHSTIIHAHKKIRKGLKEDENLARMVDDLKQIIIE